MKVADKRCMERFDLRLPASIYSRQDKIGRSSHYQTKDICAVGAFFKTDNPLGIGSEVKIDLILPLDELKKLEGTRTLIKISGEVIRTDEEGMAVCFNDSYEILPLAE